MVQNDEPAIVFLSYAQKDKELLEQLEKHLSPLQRQGLVSLWSDQLVKPGDDRSQEIDKQLEKASIILLLISSDFLASDYSYGVEMHRALERHKRHEARVIPIILRPVVWRESVLASLSCLPSDGVPVTQWPDLDAAFDACVRDLRRLLGRPTTAPLQQQPPERTRMLKRLHHSYQEALSKSLQNAAWLELGLAHKPDAVQNAAHFLWRGSDQVECALPFGTSILQAYDEAGQELLILGKPGAGKSTLLLELAQRLVQRAETDEAHALPIILPLSSWAIKRSPLHNWIAEQLSQIYDISAHLSEQWVRAEMILPLLDGLDELEETARPACITAINDYHRAHLLPLVVCSRKSDYEAASQQRMLALQAAIVVQPLTPEQVDAHFLQAGKPLAALRSVLKKNNTLRELATTPLMLSVLMLTYQGTTIRELSKKGTLLQQQIWEDYIKSMVEHKGDIKRYPQQQTCEWLGWFARQMRQQGQSLLFLEQLQPDWLDNARMKQWYTWLGIRLPAILIGMLLGLGLYLLFKPSDSSSTPHRDMLINILTGVLLGALLSRPHTRELFQVKLVKAVQLGLGMGLLVVLIDFSMHSTFVVPLFFDGAIWGGSFLVLTLMLSLGEYAGSMPTTHMTWKHICTFKPLHQGLLIGGLVALMWGLSGVLVRGLFREGNYVLDYGISYGFLGMLLSMLFSGRAVSIQPAELLILPSPKRLLVSMAERTHKRNTSLVGLGSMLLIGLSFCLRYWLVQRWVDGLSYGLSYGLGDGLGIAVSYWLLVGLFQSTSSESLQEDQRTRPNQGIDRSFRNGVFLGLVSGGICMIGSGFALLTGDVLNRALYSVAHHSALNQGLSNGFRIGLSTALSASPILGLAGLLAVFLLRGGFAWWRHWILRILLRCSHVLPLYLVRFLDDADRRIILYKVGGGYRFIHDLLRDYLVSHVDK